MNDGSAMSYLAVSMGQRIADLEVQLAVTRAELASAQSKNKDKEEEEK